jgi:hypothetical protein
VYVDEAGISKDEPILVVCAVIVHADDQLVAVERHLGRLVSRFIPAEHQESFVFHATELFNGGGKVFTRRDPEWPLETRLKIADALAAVLKRFRLPIVASWANKAGFATAPAFRDSWNALDERQRATLAHGGTFMMCAAKIDQWMREQARNEVCLLIVEDNNEARSVLRSFHRVQQDKGRPGAFSGVGIGRINEDLLFQQKRPSSALQLADFCAYVLKRSLMGDPRYDRFINPMRGQFYRTFSSRRSGEPLH